MATTKEPTLQVEGNLRLVSIPFDAWPDDPSSSDQQLINLLGDQAGVSHYGPLSLMLERPPAGDPVSNWRGQIGRAVIGEPKAVAPLLVEDFRQLQALSLPHYGPIDEIAATHQTLTDHARAMSWMLRPYWRVALHIRYAPDQHVVPEPIVSVFVDR